MAGRRRALLSYSMMRKTLQSSDKVKRKKARERKIGRKQAEKDLQAQNNRLVEDET